MELEYTVLTEGKLPRGKFSIGDRVRVKDRTEAAAVALRNVGLHGTVVKITKRVKICWSRRKYIDVWYQVRLDNNHLITHPSHCFEKLEEVNGE